MQPRQREKAASSIIPLRPSVSSHSPTTPKDLEAPYFMGVRGLYADLCSYQTGYEVVQDRGLPGGRAAVADIDASFCPLGKAKSVISAL